MLSLIHWKPLLSQTIHQLPDEYCTHLVHFDTSLTQLNIVKNQGCVKRIFMRINNLF